jgi:tetratricopeptide (TPR) repeat protein
MPSLRRPGSGDRKPLSLKSVTFDTAGWVSTNAWNPWRRSLEWKNAHGDTLRADVAARADVPLRASDLAVAREFYRREAVQYEGGIVSVEAVDAGGVRSLEVLDKRRRGLGYAYRGVLAIPMGRAGFTLTTDAIEHGTTGVREAVVTAHLFERGDLKIEAGPDGKKVVKGWFQDPYDADYQGNVLHCLADDERLDALFPDHPLSRTRAYLKRIRKSVAIDASVAGDDAPAATTSEAGDAARVRTPLSAAAIASLYLVAQRFERAAELLAASVAEMETTGGKADDVAQQLLLLGLAYDCLGRPREAEGPLSRSRDLFTATLGPDHPGTAQAVTNLARIYLHLGRHAEAEPLFVQALKVFERQDSPGTTPGVALNGLGLVHNARGLHAQAIPYFERALENFEAFEKASGGKVPDCADVLRNMAVALRETGDEKRALDALQRAGRIAGGRA